MSLDRYNKRVFRIFTSLLGNPSYNTGHANPDRALKDSLAFGEHFHNNIMGLQKQNVKVTLVSATSDGASTPKPEEVKQKSESQVHGYMPPMYNPLGDNGALYAEVETLKARLYEAEQFPHYKALRRQVTHITAMLEGCTKTEEEYRSKMVAAMTDRDNYKRRYEDLVNKESGLRKQLKNFEPPHSNALPYDMVVSKLEEAVKDCVELRSGLTHTRESLSGYKELVDGLRIERDKYKSLYDGLVNKESFTEWEELDTLRLVNKELAVERVKALEGIKDLQIKVHVLEVQAIQIHTDYNERIREQSVYIKNLRDVVAKSNNLTTVEPKNITCIDCGGTGGDTSNHITGRCVWCSGTGIRRNPAYSGT